MAWTGLALTVAGRTALNQAQLSNKMNIKSIVVGDGMPPANFSTLQGLVHQLYELEDLKIEVTDSRCILTADFPKVDYDYYFREIGVIVITDEGEKLYVYDNCGDDAQYMVSTTGVETTQKRIRLSLNISNVAEITVADPGILYVDYAEFEQTTVELDAEIKINKKALADHIDDNVKHITSKERTEWNDKQTKTGDLKDNVVTFDTPSARSLFSTGEKLSNILGKIRKTLMDLKTVAFSGSYNDLSDKPTIPVPVAVKGNAESTYRTGNVNITPADIGLGNVNNTADINKPVSTAQQTAIDVAYANSNAYRDDKIAKLINGAPSTLDTLGEIAKAMQDNDNVVDALEDAIGTKANAAEFDTHVKDDVRHITSSERTKWNDALPKTGNAVSATKWAAARNINGMSVDGSADRVNYGTCSTAAATAAKTVACTGFGLITGSEITVKFAATNTASNPTLNVNGTGAKAIYYRGAAITAGYLAANSTYIFRYNGTQWDLVAAENVDDHAVVFTNADSTNPVAWTDVTALASGLTIKTILNRVSQMFKNVRYLYKLIGTTSISDIGNGTVTGALSQLNTDIVTRPRNQIEVEGNIILCVTGASIMVGSFPLPFYVDSTDKYDVSVIRSVLANTGDVTPTISKAKNSLSVNINYQTDLYTHYQSQALYLRMLITFN